MANPSTHFAIDAVDGTIESGRVAEGSWPSGSQCPREEEARMQSDLVIDFPIKGPANAKALPEELPPLMPDLATVQDHLVRAFLPFHGRRRREASLHFGH